ncbi:unnamed protein product [Auanema sp. JU1783]|nr:unnamed protein product [Auanema sp. JU1783]
MVYQMELYRSDLADYIRDIESYDNRVRLLNFSPRDSWVVGEIEAQNNYLFENSRTIIIIMRLTNYTCIPLYVSYNKDFAYARTYFSPKEENLIVIFSLLRTDLKAAGSTGTHSSTAQLNVIIPYLGIKLRFVIGVHLIVRRVQGRKQDKSYVYMGVNEFAFNTGTQLVFFRILRKPKEKTNCKNAFYITKKRELRSVHVSQPVLFQVDIKSKRNEYNFTNRKEDADVWIAYHIFDPEKAALRIVCEAVKKLTAKGEYYQVRRIIDHETDVLSIINNCLEICMSVVVEVHDDNLVQTYFNYEIMLCWNAINNKLDVFSARRRGLVSQQQAFRNTWYPHRNPFYKRNFIDNGSGDQDEFDENACSTISSNCTGIKIVYFDNKSPPSRDVLLKWERSRKQQLD